MIIQDQIRRYEYKYAIPNVKLDTVLHNIRYHSAGFYEAYPQRRVNNFYLDTLNLDYFYQNVDGISRRRKFRYRWYGEFEIATRAVLETKHKDNELGWKDIKELRREEISSKESLTHHFRAQGLTLAELSPCLYNSYSRYYFVSSDGRFRITVDYNQHFGLPYYFDRPYKLMYSDPTVILELKFDESDHPDRGIVMRELLYLRTKNSKYANGVTKIHLS